jgi:GMP synthase PP-ATPase subunit
MRAFNAIRVPREITRERLDMLRLVDDVFIEEIRGAGLYDGIWRSGGGNGAGSAKRRTMFVMSRAATLS